MSKRLRSILAPTSVLSRRAPLAGALISLLAARSASADGTPPPPPLAPAPAPAATAPASGPMPSLYTTADAGPAKEPTGKTRFGFGASLTTDYYRAPIDVLGIAAFIELGDTEDAGVWAPLVRLTGARAASSMGTGTDTASFNWLTLALDGCPVQATLVAQRVWIRPCARVSGGLLSASATADGQAVDAHKPWVTAGALARLQWRPVGPLFFEVQGGAAYAFTHDAVTLGTTMSALPVLQPALFEPFGSLGVGLTF